MSMNHTTPEPRVNKLGHVVTKHVRMQDMTVGSRVKLPSLAAIKTDRETTVDSIMGNIDVGVQMGKDAVPLLREALNKLDSETLAVIAAGAEWDHEHNDKQRMIFMYTRITTDNVGSLREDFTYMPVFSNDAMHSEMVDMIRGLHKLEFFKNRDDLDKLTGVDRRIAEAMLRVTEASDLYTSNRMNIKYDWHYDYSVLHIDNEDLMNLVVDFPEKVEDMLAFIKDRGSNDPQQMLDYLRNGTALRDGVL